MADAKELFKQGYLYFDDPKDLADYLSWMGLVKMIKTLEKAELPPECYLESDSLIEKTIEYCKKKLDELNATTLYLVTRDDVKITTVKDFCEAYNISDYEEYYESNGEVPGYYDTESKQEAADYAKTMYGLEEISEEDYKKICEKLNVDCELIEEY